MIVHHYNYLRFDLFGRIKTKVLWIFGNAALPYIEKLHKKISIRFQSERRAFTRKNDKRAGNDNALKAACQTPTPYHYMRGACTKFLFSIFSFCLHFQHLITMLYIGCGLKSDGSKRVTSNNRPLQFGQRTWISLLSVT